MGDYLSDELYEMVTQSVPIVCVDIIPVINKRGKYEAGMIVRATGSQAGKLTVLGGRVYHSETIDKAIARHLKTDLGVEAFAYFNGSSAENPFMVQQYFMKDGPEGERYGFDPTKHAVTPTYLVEIDEALVVPQLEASGFVWIKDIIDDPAAAGYNQHIVVNKALQALNAAHDS